MNTERIAERNARKTRAFAADLQGAERILVVGCGDGRETGILARRFDAATVGVGLDNGRFDPHAAHPAVLVEMDARRLAFIDGAFDTVYSFHALEHIPQPERALKEMRRVLGTGGRYLVGTPNKSRLVGYLGAAEPLWDRIRSNLGDYRMRLTGRWSNEAGAHAGFTRRELLSLCEHHIGPARDITDDYYDRLYPDRAGLLGLLRRTGMDEYMYPAVYVSGVVRPPEEPSSTGLSHDDQRAASDERR